MAASRVRVNCDNPRLPTLSLGLSSVRHIVGQIEAERARAIVSHSQCESRRELVEYNPKTSCDDCYDSPFVITTGTVCRRFAVNLGSALSKCVPSVSFGNFTLLAVAAGFFAPRMLSYLVIYPFCRLVFGTLYPAYASYKAVRTKNLKEYVKWMMYWIVFALFTCTETFTDVFLSWFPFYYEVKIVLVLWLLSPATKGSSILYRKFVHPALCRREQEIDEYIAKAKDQGYHTVLNLGTKGVNYATTVIMQTAIKGGGGLVQQIRKSYSLSDLSECEPQERTDETDDVITEPRQLRRNVKTVYRRSASESNSRSPLYFPEVDVNVRVERNRADEPDFSHIKSSEDISSGYSSADNNSGSLTRAGSMSAGARARASVRSTRTAVTTIKRPQAAEGNEVIIEELRDDDSFDYANMPPLVNLPPNLYLSHTSPPFIYQYVGDEVKIIQVLGDYPLNPNFQKIQTNNSDQRDQKEAIAKDVSSKSDLVDTELKVDENSDITILNDNSTPINSQNVDKDLKVDDNSEIKRPNDNISPINPQNIDLNNIVTRTHENDDDNNDKKCDLENKDKKTNSNIKHDTETENKDNNLSKIDIVVIKEEHDFENKNKSSSKEINENVKESDLESTSIDASVYENESAESDDEASFGTPDDSPKAKRKSPKGKYGKSKAPQPPPPPTMESGDNNNEKSTDEKSVENATLEKEKFENIITKLPKTNFKDTGNKKGLNVINPIFEKKRRHKSKSPNRHPKGSSSGIGKLLQLPGKLAFWHKTDDKSKDNSSVSSGDDSRRSSTIEKTIEEIQNSTNIDNSATIGNIFGSNEERDITDDQISFKDAAEYIDIENEAISHDIKEKSDALQKLIDAKLESHPEYKIVALHEELPTSSKSTDV